MEVYDYTDPICPFCTEQYEKEPSVRAIPIDRVLLKLDECLAHNDAENGKKLLLYWLSEARLGGDERGEITVLNELMGLCRNMGQRDEAYMYAEDGLKLAENADYKNTVTGATVSLNAATVCKAFGDLSRSLKLYSQTMQVYEKYLKADDYRLGSLYNNMGLVYFEMKDYKAAEELYKKALNIMKILSDREGEQAITYLNMADLISARDGAEKGERKINECLDNAEKMLEKAVKRDGKYAFMCEKCASVFGYYGRFFYEEILKKRVAEIYERA